MSEFSAMRSSQVYGGVYGFEDVPHEIDAALSTDECLPMSFGDGSRRCDEFEPDEANAFILDEVRVCPKPDWFNSGAHRVLFFLHYRNEPFVMAVEEQEDFACRLAGQQVTFGGMSPAAEAMLDASHEEVSRLLLQGAWRAVTGGELETDSALESVAPAPRFFFERARADDILAQGCESRQLPCTVSIFSRLANWIFGD